MSVPAHASGYDVSKDVPVSRGDCHITVGFDKQKTHIPRFLVRLHYATSFLPARWTEIARFDHNETAATGHNVYQQGLHIDVKRKSGQGVTLYPSHGKLNRNRGAVIRACVDYFDREANYFVDIFKGNQSPTGAPGWPDGGKIPRILIRQKPIVVNMHPDRGGENTVSQEELTEILAEATGVSAEEIERGADEIDIAPPEQADVVNE